jgi:TonB family protein
MMRSFCLVLFLLVGSTFQTRLQEVAPKGMNESPPEITALANELAVKIAESGKKRVVVFDFQGPDKQWLPISGWLADQFSLALINSRLQIEVMDRSHLAAALDAQHKVPKDLFEDMGDDNPEVSSIAESLNADVFVLGSFGAAVNGIGLSAIANRTSEYLARKPHSTTWWASVYGKLPMTSEMAGYLTLPLDSLRPMDGILNSGKGGVTPPKCVRCPRAKYPTAAYNKKLQGVVVLDAIVTTDGRVAQIRVRKSAGPSLDTAAADAVRAWKLEPATDPDGRVVPVHQIFEITFHLY